MKKLTFLSVLVGVIFCSMAQEVEQKKTKLLIGIVVDQLRYDYLDKFSEDFSKEGFNRLLNEGFYARNVNYNYKPTYTGPGHASIFTGTTPSIHGIVGNNWYSRAEKGSVYCVELKDEEGNKYYSPERMKSRTIADEVRLFTNFRGKSYGVSLKDRGAILPAGHLANGAYWFNGKKGKWVSSNFYKESNPDWLKEFNSIDLKEKYLNKDWVLLAEESVYKKSLADKNPYEGELYEGSGQSFPYDLKKGFEKKGYDILKSIPQGNSMTVDIALSLIQANQLGEDEFLDFLSVSFSATDYVGHRFGVNSREVQDTYLRLDREIARLLNHLDKKIGKDNYLLFLTSDHGAGEVPAFLQAQSAPAGYLDAKLIKSTIEEELDKKYGEADWVEYFINFNLYFNKTALLEKEVDLNQLNKTVTRTLLQMEGIADVFHQDREVYNSKYNRMIKNGLLASESGDLVILESPNYIIYSTTGSTHGSPYHYDTHVPLIFYGGGIINGESFEPYRIIDIAPTAAAILKIPFPDGVSGRVINEVLINK